MAVLIQNARNRHTQPQQKSVHYQRSISSPSCRASKKDSTRGMNVYPHAGAASGGCLGLQETHGELVQIEWVVGILGGRWGWDGGWDRGRSPRWRGNGEGLRAPRHWHRLVHWWSLHRHIGVASVARLPHRPSQRGISHRGLYRGTLGPAHGRRPHLWGITCLWGIPLLLLLLRLKAQCGGCSKGGGGHQDSLPASKGVQRCC